jgi:hypothetical protein
MEKLGSACSSPVEKPRAQTAPGKSFANIECSATKIAAWATLPIISF